MLRGQSDCSGQTLMRRDVVKIYPRTGIQRVDIGISRPVEADIDSPIAPPHTQFTARRMLQKVTVEHVHVHEGGQAIVGNVEGGGIRTKSENQPHAITHAPGETLRSTNTEREAVPVAGNDKR